MRNVEPVLHSLILLLFFFFPSFLPSLPPSLPQDPASSSVCVICHGLCSSKETGVIRTLGEEMDYNTYRYVCLALPPSLPPLLVFVHFSFLLSLLHFLPTHFLYLPSLPPALPPFLSFDFAGNGDSEGDFRYTGYTQEVEDLRAVVEVRLSSLPPSLPPPHFLMFILPSLPPSLPPSLRASDHTDGPWPAFSVTLKGRTPSFATPAPTAMSPR